MKAYIFPGQGTQFPGMGKDLYDKSPIAKTYFKKANELLGYSISDVMFEGTNDDLKKTKYTQPAIFLHSYALIKALGNDFKPDVVSGHSMGEISALAAIDVIDFDSALKLINERSILMQRICESESTGMAIVVGLYDVIVDNICRQVDGVVVPANYNTINQVVISGNLKSIEQIKKNIGKTARVINLKVGGAFHSPYMEPMVEEFKIIIDKIKFNKPICSIYQNVTARPTSNLESIKRNLIYQLTNPIKWRHTILHMLEDGVTNFVEVGAGKFLQSLVKKIDRTANVSTIKNTLIN